MATTIFNFKCKDCGHTIGQLVTDSVPSAKEDVPCPNCGSFNVDYDTRF